MSRTKELLGVLRGAQTVIDAGLKLQEDCLNVVWRNSSIKKLAKNCSKSTSSSEINVNDLIRTANETVARANTVIAGIKAYASYTPTATKDKRVNLTSYATQQQPLPKPPPVPVKKTFDIKLTASDKALLKKLDMEHRKKIAELNGATKQGGAKMHTVEVTFYGDDVKEQDMPNSSNKIKAVPNPKSKQSLSASAKQRPVPSSRIGRMVSFGTLAAGLGVGTIAEYTRRTLGIGGTEQPNMLFLTDANMERIVDTLCKVRGAALKIGQILSIQDDTIVNPQLSKALERVRKSADFMPKWQLEKVLVSELGDNWRQNLADFEEKPFAAASIGQVHCAKTKGGKNVAIKVQYPGVAKGIESDIDNLFAVMNMWNLFPEGMFVENLVSVAKRELAWEVDYLRESECTKKFRKLLEPYPDYYVPEVIDNLTTKQVFTTELLAGVPVDECVNMDHNHRSFIASKILELILRELLEFRYMQTDPNWANFLYNPLTKQIMLLDFGASREYSEDFVDKYVKIIKASIDEDRQQVLAVSKEIGFLTGYESKLMADAHVDAVMILGEVFKKPGEYDFGMHNTTERLQKLIPTVITHRLCPPPEEIYSLHRKLSGIFMLCAKLKVKIPSSAIFSDLYGKYQMRKQ